jgi:hypothetical protein
MRVAAVRSVWRVRIDDIRATSAAASEAAAPRIFGSGLIGEGPGA